MPTSLPTGETALGLRERKNRDTQRAIVRAAADLVIEGGYAAATIPRIAERADVAPRTVSTWFPVKDDILFERVDENIARAAQHLRTGSGDVVDRLQAWLTDEATREQPDPEIARLRNLVVAHDPDLRARAHRLYDQLQGEIAAAVARDVEGSAEDVGPQAFAGATMSFLLAMRAIALERPGSGAGGQMAEGFAFLRAGLAAITPPD